MNDVTTTERRGKNVTTEWRRKDSPAVDVRYWLLSRHQLRRRHVTGGRHQPAGTDSGERPGQPGLLARGPITGRPRDRGSTNGRRESLGSVLPGHWVTVGGGGRLGATALNPLRERESSWREQGCHLSSSLMALCSAVSVAYYEPKLLQAGLAVCQLL